MPIRYLEEIIEQDKEKYASYDLYEISSFWHDEYEQEVIDYSWLGPIEDSPYNELDPSIVESVYERYKYRPILIIDDTKEAIYLGQEHE